MSPSSAIQRRSQAPQPNIAPTTSTLTHRLIRTVASYRKAGQRACRPATVAFIQSAEEDGGTEGSDPHQAKQLHHPVLQDDLLGLASHATVDVDRISQDRDRDGDDGHREPPRV